MTYIPVSQLKEKERGYIPVAKLRGDEKPKTNNGFSFNNPFNFATAQSTPSVSLKEPSLPFTVQNLKDTITGIPQALAEANVEIGQLSFRAYGAIASAITGKPLIP